MIEFEVVHNGVPDHMERGKEAVDLIVAFSAKELEEQLGDNAPVGEDRHLSESFYTEPLAEQEYRVLSDDPAADWVKHGTGLRRTGEGGSRDRIKPKSGQALKFFWRKAGTMTVWKGDAIDPARFSRWAMANGMMPFNMWPAGQYPQDYVNPSIAETLARVPELGEKAMIAAGAHR